METVDKIEVIGGQYSGRSGEFLKNCSAAFPEWCRIKLDLKGREKANKVIMILKKDIQPK